MPHDEKPTSIWKKEMSFRRKPPEPAPEPDPVAVEPVEPVAEPVRDDVATEMSPVVVPAPVEHDWLTQPLEEVSEPPAPQPSEPAPITLVPRVEDPTPTLVPPLEPDVDLDPEPELPPVAQAPASEIPVLPPLPEPDAPAIVVSDLAGDPVAEGPRQAPFYKRELSLKRTSRERPPKPERRKRERRVKVKPEKAEKGEKTPFYKRELRAKPAPRQWDAAEPPAPSKPKLRRTPRPKPSVRPGAGSTRKLVGLKIGGSQIAAAQIHNNGSPELVQAVREPLEHGIVVGGELRDPEALAAALKEFFARHKLPRRGVRLGIANNRIGVRTFDVVGIDDPKQLANAIRFRAQEVLPIPIEEAVLDYQVLSESTNDEGQPVRRVLLVVAYRELVDRYVYACRKAGIQVVGIDLEAFALLRSLAEPHDAALGAERGAVVAVSVGHDRSTFAVSDGRVCEFTRVLEWGGGALNVAIARVLDISPSEAEPIKRRLSLTRSDDAVEGFSPDQLATALEAVRGQLQAFARELVSSLQFYQNQPGSLGIGEIALTGGTAHLPGLAGELERLIGVPVRVADPTGRVKISKKLGELEQAGSLAIAIGLGIED